MSVFAAVLAYVVLETQSGKELHWDQASVPYSFNQDGSDDLGNEVFGSLGDSFQHWNQACSIHYTDQGHTALTSASFFDGAQAAGNETPDDSSVVAWTESSWLYGSATIAITFTWFNPDTGQIG